MPERDKRNEDHRGLVRALAIKVRTSLSRRLDVDDLVAYGSTGLVEAARRWDPGRGVAFKTFAYYRIRGAIFDGLRKQGWLGKRAFRRYMAGTNALLQEELQLHAARDARGRRGVLAVAGA